VYYQNNLSKHYVLMVIVLKRIVLIGIKANAPLRDRYVGAKWRDVKWKIPLISGL
jgi:hypothetical protein